MEDKYPELRKRLLNMYSKGEELTREDIKTLRAMLLHSKQWSEDLSLEKRLEVLDWVLREQLQSDIFDLANQQTQVREALHIMVEPPDDSELEKQPAPRMVAWEEIEPKRPPKFGEFIFYLLLSKNTRDAVLGDLAEDYIVVFNKFGRRWAWWFYYCQVIKSLGPLAARCIRKVFKWGVISEAVRRMFS